jgi:hypothetical protein
MAMQFSPSNPMHLPICLGNIDGNVRVKVDPDAEAYCRLLSPRFTI